MLPTGGGIMLTKWKRYQAAEIAQVLSRDGMLFGKELEEFIKLEEFSGLIALKENEIDEFIDEIIECVEAAWKRVVAIYDFKENTTKIYLNATDASKELETTLEKIYVYKHKRYKLKRRSLISEYKPSINDLTQGLNIVSQSREGCYLQI